MIKIWFEIGLLVLSLVLSVWLVRTAKSRTVLILAATSLFLLFFFPFTSLLAVGSFSLLPEYSAQQALIEKWVYGLESAAFIFMSIMLLWKSVKQKPKK